MIGRLGHNILPIAITVLPLNTSYSFKVQVQSYKYYASCVLLRPYYGYEVQDRSLSGPLWI